MAQKKKKKNSIIQDARKETTMPSNEKSILTMPTGIFNKFDDNIDNHSAKLSLDSKTKNEIANEIDIQQEPTRISFPLAKDVKETDPFTNVSKKKIKEEACSENVSSPFVQELGMY